MKVFRDFILYYWHSYFGRLYCDKCKELATGRNELKRKFGSKLDKLDRN